MKLDAVFEEMENALNELNEQFETIKTHEIRVPQIEIDILMATTRKLYESMAFLNKKNQFSDVAELSSVSEKQIPEKEIPEEKTPVEEPHAQTDNQTEAPEETIDFEKVTEDFLSEAESLIEEVPEKEALEEAISEMPNEINEEVTKEHPSLLLQFEDEIFSVNDAVATKAEDKSVVSKLSNSRIENLKSAIGINDKFYFINELFKGNSQAYEDVIYTLNNFKRFEDAMQYTSTLKYRYDWDMESEAYQKLIHFLERKFVEIHA